MSNNNKSLEFLVPEKELVALLNSGYTTKELAEKFSLKISDLTKEFYKLLINHKIILSSEEYQLILNEYSLNCSFKTFPEGQVVIISDTHLASKYENLDYLKQVRDFLLENDIEYLLHGGDVGDGLVKYPKTYSTISKQLEHILAVYDLGTTVKQFILGGNHDAKYKKKNSADDILDLLEKNNHNITSVGYYQAYFKLGSNVVSFEHNSYYMKSFIGRDFSILGHSHYLEYKDSTLILPTLSDDFLVPHKPQEPGFILMDNKLQNNHTKVEFTNYKTTSHGLQKGKTKTYTLR